MALRVVFADDNYLVRKGISALLAGSDPDHAACVAVLDRHDGPLLLSPLVLAELDFLVRFRLGAQGSKDAG